MTELPYVFSVIQRRLYVTYLTEAGAWTWQSLGQPTATVTVARGVGAVAAQTRRYDYERPMAFVIGSDGHLWSAAFDGTNWGWTDHRTPGVPVKGSAGVVAVLDQPHLIPRPYAFVIDGDGNLWSQWWNGTQWSWTPHGTPTAAPLSPDTARVGVTTEQPVAEGPEQPQVFLLADGENGEPELWQRGADGGEWAWTRHGRPDGRGISAGLGALNDNGPVLRTGYLSAFVAVAADVYELRVTDAGAEWRRHGALSGPGIETAGAVTLLDDAERLAQPYLFLIDPAAGPVVVHTAVYDEWTWGTIPGTRPTHLGNFATGTAVAAVREHTTGAQTPYVFSLTKAATLQAAWLE